MPLIKKFYDSLAEGKIFSTKCDKCGTYVFPPKTICPKCFNRDLKWVEISGEAKLLQFARSSVPAEPFQEYAPYAYGLVKLKEGPVFFSMITGIDVSSDSKTKEALDKLPLDVKAEIRKVAGLAVVTFSVK